MLKALATHLSSRPRRSLALVAVFVVIAGVIGGPVTGMLRSSGGFAPGSSDSQVATDMLQKATGTKPSATLVLLVRTPQGATAPSAVARVAAVRHRLSQVPGVARTAGPAAVARDGDAVLVTGTAYKNVSDEDVGSATESAFDGQHDVVVGGASVANQQINSTVGKDLGFAELLAFPILLVLSLIFFRGRATLMPLISGVVTVLGTFLVLRAVNSVYGISTFALNLVIGMGLGLAIDYTLFIVTRYRQELAAGAPPAEALVSTMTRAGRTVCFSAVTVAGALITLTVFPQNFLKSMGIAGAIVALVAALSAVTVSSALLGLWGAGVARGRAGRVGGGAGWYRFASAVMRRPGIVAAVTAAAMIAAALPALSAHWTPATDSSVIPKGDSARIVADAIATEFAGAGKSPLSIAIGEPRVDGASVRGFAHRVAALPEVSGVARARYLGSATWELDAEVNGDTDGSAAQTVVRRIRSLAGSVNAHVTGSAAEFVDQQAAIGSRLPIVLALLAALTFLVLWLMTNSIVLPLKAIVMNALTVGAALSAVVVVYQHGRLTGLLHYTPDGGVETTSFVVAAAVVFALSTDYGVFLLARIKEQRDSGTDDREAVASGLGATGRVVTAAAILLAVAIGAFSTSQISFIQQLGVAVAIGVLLDAFVVRSLLVPSLMGLLGHLNWWSPGFVHRLHDRLAPGEGRGGTALAHRRMPVTSDLPA